MYDISAAPIVRFVRERAGISQRALAESARTTQAAVARIESGEVKPSVETLRRLVCAAGFELQLHVTEARIVDPVVEAYKPGVDQTLLIMQLRKTPRERFRDLLSARQFILKVRRVGQESRRKVAERQSKYGAENDG